MKSHTSRLTLAAGLLAVAGMITAPMIGSTSHSSKSSATEISKSGDGSGTQLVNGAPVDQVAPKKGGKKK